MNLNIFKQSLITKGIEFSEHEILAPYTTWKIGGEADVFINLRDPKVLPEILKLAKECNVPITFLGGGSNVLISDSGIRGLVIRNAYSGITIADQLEKIDAKALSEAEINTPEPEARLLQANPQEYYDFAKLNYDESDAEKVKVVLNSGTFLSYAINYLISQGITGLQWYAGIPGTIGGAIYNTIHGGSHFISEYLEAVEIIDEQGNFKTLTKAEIGIAYDHSKLQEMSCFICRGFFNFPKGDALRAQKTAIAWAMAKKAKQPYNSAGCCFKNITEEERQELNLISNSWGYIIDQELKLKGYSVGGAAISDQHAAFIVNNGNATASDVISILNRIYDSSKEKLQGLTPKAEIFFLGFQESEISKFK